MSTRRRVSTKSEIRRSLHAMKWTQGKNRVLCVLGVFVTLGVAFALMQSVMAAKGKVRVLDCPVTEAVAHHHNEDCYADGELVCPLPERGLHIHDESCYERQLACGLEEGEGHKHTKDCYDSDGNVICGFEESEAHKHTDDCYADVLVCDKEEVVNEHVHGDGCFHVVATDDEAEQTPQPAQSFAFDLVDDDNALVMRVEASAPEGALPDNTTMIVKSVDSDSVDRDALQKAVDEKAAKLESLEPGKLLDLLAVDITFEDVDGNTVQPEKDVTVLLSSRLVTSEDKAVALRVDNAFDSDGEGIEVATPNVTVLDTLSEKQVIKSGLMAGENQLAFQSDSFGSYVLATTSTSQHREVSDDSSVTVTLDAPAEAGIPANASLEVKEIGEKDKDYDGYVDRTADATDIDKEDVGLARFFDITITDGEKEIQPQAPVSVSITLNDVPSSPTDFKLVHFAEDGEGKQAEAPEELAAGGENGTTTFDAESFSVYGIVYTVDFGYQVGDEVYEYSIQGGGAIGVTDLIDKLHIYEDAAKKYDTAAKLAAGIENVEFSDPKLVRVLHVDQKATVGQLRADNNIDVWYSDDVSEEQRAQIEATEYENEWVLFSLVPFQTTELLTITMDDGSQLFVKVTDNSNPPAHLIDGRNIVDTIANPGATTIDLFDYWIDDGLQNATFHNQWPDYNNNNTDGNGLKGRGNDSGINQGHTLKFTPAYPSTVYYPDHSKNSDGGGQANDYTRNADPTQGIVARTLSGGYPVLSGNKKMNTESLEYLFDDTSADIQGTGHRAGKRVYKDVDQLLYIDKTTGFYTFDSRDVDAVYNGSSNTFSEQLFGNWAQDQERLGFWPFGYGNWWFGMHVNTQFIMPENGQVANINSGQLQDMKFMFSGDDDAWVYIDGVLIGDGGGIHNRTEIDINFATGEVVVTGLEDKRHKGSLVQPTTLKQIFTEVKGQDYVDEHFDGEVFKKDSVHTFDFFYLERGGGESNLLLSYNLLSTTDFQAKKNYSSEDPNKALEKDQFQFVLLGANGRIKADGSGTISGKENETPIMPSAPSSGKGTVDDPQLTPVNQPIKYDSGGSTQTTTVKGLAYVTGNRADGSIIFGSAQIPEPAKADLDAYLEWMDEHPGATPQDAEAAGKSVPKYRYVVSEVVPPTATNAEGVTWQNATVDEMVKGGFYDGATLYDSTFYFMELTLTKQQAMESDGVTPATDSSGRPVYEYVLAPTFYDSILFDNTIPNDPANPIKLEFTNTYIEPVWLNVVKADSKTHTPISGAKFEFGFARYDNAASRWVMPAAGGQITTGADGKISLGTGLHPGNYLLNEFEAPKNYKQSNFMWLIEMVDSRTVKYGASDHDEGVDPSTFNPNPPRIVPFITRLNKDGTKAGERTMFDVTDTTEVGDGTNNVHALEAEFPNEKIEDFKLTVQKEWEQIQGDDSALNDSQIEVSLGRYVLTDRYATINIVKTGVPQDANVTAVYVVYRIQDGKEERFATIAQVPGMWSGDPQGDTIAVLNVPVTEGEETKYRVSELIFYDDDSYVHVHNDQVANPQEVMLSEGDNETVTFTADYSRAYGDIYITTHFTDNRTDTSTPINNSNVYYYLLDSDYKTIKKVSYAEVNDTSNPNYVPGKGYHLGRYEVGDYQIMEYGWPSNGNYDAYFNGYFGYGGSTVGARLVRDTDNIQNFDVEYRDLATTTVHVILYDRTDPYNTAVEIKRLDDPVLPIVVPHYGLTSVSFNSKPGPTDYTDTDRNKANDSVIVGEGYMRNEFGVMWDSVADGTQPDQVMGATSQIDRLVINELDPSLNHTYVYIGVDGTNVTMSDINPDDISVWFSYMGPPLIPPPSDPEPDGSRSMAFNAGATNAASLPADAVLRGALENAASTGSQDGASAGREVKLEGNTVNLMADSLPKELLGAAGAGGALRSAANGIKPGNYQLALYWSSKDGPGAPPTDTATEKFVVDTPFNDDQVLHPIVLTQNDYKAASNTWAQTIVNDSDYPAYDEDGNKYYYYISSVIEKKMPEGTTGQILTDQTDSTKQRLAYFIEPDPANPDVVPDPQHLAVSNKVAQPADVKLYKVDANDTTVLLEGAKFHLQKKDDQSQWQTVKDPDVEALVSGESVDLDAATGIFTVPKGGMKINGLLIGEYKLVEDECPAGYVMNITEYTFKVNQGGQLYDVDSNFIYDDDVDALALFVPNPPGTELPHAGGIGATLFSVAGVTMMVIGAMMLLKRHREA